MSLTLAAILAESANRYPERDAVVIQLSLDRRLHHVADKF